MNDSELRETMRDAKEATDTAKSTDAGTVNLSMGESQLRGLISRLVNRELEARIEIYVKQLYASQEAHDKRNVGRSVEIEGGLDRLAIRLGRLEHVSDVTFEAEQRQRTAHARAEIPMPARSSNLNEGTATVGYRPHTDDNTRRW